MCRMTGNLQDNRTIAAQIMVSHGIFPIHSDNKNLSVVIGFHDDLFSGVLHWYQHGFLK